MKVEKKSIKMQIFYVLAVLCLCVFVHPLNHVKYLTANATSASSMIVLEARTNRILNQSNAYARRYMASTTKILTAITVIKNCDVNSVVSITKEMCGIEGSSIYLQVGEQIKVLDLLYGLMLQSGNDAATALAIFVGGSVKGFAQLMNKTAKEAGANNSNFVNPHGLHDDNHYTTAYDLGLISTYALRDKTFATICATKSHIVNRPVKGWKHNIKNKNKILNTFQGGDGVKTGFTKKAGRCLVSSATQNGMQVVCVVLNCGPMFEECRQLMSHAFKQYSLTKILPSYNYFGDIAVKNGRVDKVGAYSHRSLYYPLRVDEVDSVTKIVEYDLVVAPIQAEQKLGKIKIYLHNRLIFEEDLYSVQSVQSNSILDKLKEWFK
ncbi:MAG: D-alanyl-D-alanine carboxypeptidase [Clostridiales bacterium]|nr:D-alanyl-D-alanine carboxypeptidase [Clostridiales bacterium]